MLAGLLITARLVGVVVATARKTYVPRSYWRFENASETLKEGFGDEQGRQQLKNWEGIGQEGGEAIRWRSQPEGGLVGGWMNSTGLRSNCTFETYWEAEMGSVPLNQTQTPTAAGITVELLIKPGSCFGRGGEFNFFAGFPPGPGRACGASITSGSINWGCDTVPPPPAAAGLNNRSAVSSDGVPVDTMKVGVQQCTRC
eukprot:COSAG01_NODE_1174_length_11380_cov_2.922205_14_plen_199_part_00